MAEYDFTSALSPLDFELLSKDLLEAALNIRLENFREGKDSGIDLRYAPAKWHVVNGSVVVKASNTPEIIVQCKRYSRFADLKHVLKVVELPKIVKLNPSRYIIATSLSLSPDQADEIKHLLQPYVKTTDDIFSRERLNSLLRKHQEIERRHIKLWIGSTGVLETILNARTHIVSREEIERTIEAAKLYVRNNSFDEALEVLKKHRVCIIAGQPGIGKTTLARMLLLYFYDKKYDIVKIEGDISEARDIGFNKRPRFYYYDDFLGQTARADKLNKNEDQKLIDFMDSIRCSQESVFVLTTREYILNQARLSYEKLSRQNFDHRTCIVDVSKYPRRIRAQILYNHLYFSNLPRPYIDELLAKRGYLPIVDHKNYNPRLIEYLTNMTWIGATPPAGYVDLFLRNLDNPVEIWGHAFENQLSEAARHLLVALTTVPRECPDEKQEQAFAKLHEAQCERFGIPRKKGDYRRALKEVDGTFVATRNVGGVVLVAFGNPSIRDFMKHRLILGDMVSEVVNSLVFFEQAEWLARILDETEPKTPLHTIEKHRPMIVAKLKEFLLREGCSVYQVGTGANVRVVDAGIRILPRMVAIANAACVLKDDTMGIWFDARFTELSDQLGSGVIGVYACADYLKRFKDLGYLNSENGKKLLATVKDLACDKPSNIYDFEALGWLVRDFPEIFGPVEDATIQSAYGQFIERYAGECEVSNPDEMREEASRVETIGGWFKVDTKAAMESMEERAVEIEKEIESERNWEGDEISGPDGRAEYFSDGELDSMYGSLTLQI